MRLHHLHAESQDVRTNGDTHQFRYDIGDGWIEERDRKITVLSGEEARAW